MNKKEVNYMNKKIIGLLLLTVFALIVAPKVIALDLISLAPNVDTLIFLIWLVLGLFIALVPAYPSYHE